MSEDSPTPFLRRISQGVDSRICRSFEWLGKSVSRRPCAVIWATVLFALGCGFAFWFFFEQELDGEDLYTPPGAQSFKDRDFVLETFGSPGQQVRILVTRDADFSHETGCEKRNLLGSNSDARKWLEDYMDLYHNMVNQSILFDGKELKLEDVCQKSDSASSECEVLSILGIWNYRRSTLDEDDDLLYSINRTIEKESLTSYLGVPVPTRYILGRDPDPGPCSGFVEVFQMVLILKNERETLNGLSKDRKSAAWIEKLVENMENAWKKEGLLKFALNVDSLDAESQKYIEKDVKKLVVGYILIFIFSHIILFKNSPVFCKAHLATGSIISVVMSIVTAFGLAQILRVKFNLVVQTLPFLLLGLGMDDTFVIMGAYHSTGKDLPIEDRIAATMARAGSSIFVTTITDAMAFAVGTYTRLPAVHDFAIYAFLGVIFDFFYQVTFFVALMVLDARREQRARMGAPIGGFQCCCQNARTGIQTAAEAPEQTEKSGKTAEGGELQVSSKINWKRKICGSGDYDLDKPSLFTRIAGEWIPKLTLHPFGSAVVGIIELCLLATAIYGCTKVKMDFRYRDWFIPEGSYLKAGLKVDDKYFYGDQVLVTVFTKEPTDGLDFFSHLGEYEDMLSALKQGQYVSDVPPVVSWYESYSKWLVLESPFVNELDKHGRAPNATAFTQWVKLFLDDPAGIYFSDSVKFPENRIGATKLECFTNRLVDGDYAVATVDNIRRSLTEAAPAFEPGAYSDFFLFFDGFKLITWETVRNILMAGLAVFVLTTVVLANFVASTIVTLMIALTDVMLFGFLWFAGLTFNTVTAVNMVLAVGIAVDYSAHIAHSFLVLNGSRKERAQGALHHIGGEVIAGAFTTWLAVLVMGFAEHYIFKTFFKMFFAIVVTGAWHGLVVLPIVLRYIGPKPFASHIS